jgi:hypothetical protein
MAYTFDGPNKLIILSNGTTAVDVKDMYSRWKEWVLISDNSKYLVALSVLGGDPLPGGRYLGSTYFLENDWKIRPYEGNHTLVVSGNLYSRDGSDPFVSTLGSFNVRIMLSVSNLVDTINTGGGIGTVDEVRDAVWSATNYASHGVNTAGVKLDAAGNSGDPWAADISSGYTGNQAGNVLKNVNTNVTSIKSTVETSDGKIDDIQTDISAMNLSISTLVTIVNTLLKYEKNRTRVDKNAYTLTIYDDDGVTPLKVFNLKDFNGNASYTEIAERMPQ